MLLPEALLHPQFQGQDAVCTVRVGPSHSHHGLQGLWSPLGLSEYKQDPTLTLFMEDTSIPPHQLLLQSSLARNIMP